MNKIAVIEDVERKIYQIRGKKVMFDSDLAELYGVETYQLTRQVRRNKGRFPEDFMFRLTREEFFELPIWQLKERRPAVSSTAIKAARNNRIPSDKTLTEDLYWASSVPRYSII